MRTWLGVHGTWGNDPKVLEWWENGSAFGKALRSMNVVKAGAYVWDGRVRVLRDGPWRTFGEDSLAPLVNLLMPDLVLAHSHGGQIALFALKNCAMKTLILFGTPVRRDVEQALPALLENVQRVYHVYDADGDTMGFLGGLFDGQVSLVWGGWRRPWSFRARRYYKHPRIIPVPLRGIGHSGLLNQPFVTENYKRLFELIDRARR